MNIWSDNLQRQLLIWTGVLALSSCASVSSYPQQQLHQAGMLSTAEIVRQYQIDPEWWTAYQDQQLNQLVQKALDNNLDLRQAALNAEKARYSANEVGAGLWPQGSGSLGASSSKDLKRGGASTRSFNGQLGLSYEVDVWQKVRAETEAARWSYQASRADQEASRLSLINSVIDTYFHLAYLDEAIELNHQSIKQYQQIARIATAQYRQGKVSSLNVTKAQQSLLNAQNNVLSLQENRLQMVQSLHNLLNLKPDQKLTLAPVSLQSLPDVPVNLSVPLSVLANRPDLRAAEYRLQSAYASQTAQKRSWYPSISLDTAVNSRSNRFDNALRLPVGVGSVALNLPFLNWQTLHWQTKEAEVAFKSAQVSFEQSLTTALNEVSRYHQQYRLSREMLTNSQQKHQFDLKNSHYYQVRYQYGANPLSDWLDALNTEYSSAQALLNDRYTVLQNESLIYQAMAGRYEPRMPDAKAE
ncbi:TolC family protein [Neisseriaceae bacterium ESL0693]|nr:TolC family protein [Neisseriaceae bacterium ESL0693]